jgi:hypothetical protein
MFLSSLFPATQFFSISGNRIIKGMFKEISADFLALNGIHHLMMG